MPRRPRASRGPRPKQGAHLLALRQKAGLTQAQVAEALGVPQPTIAFWEWSEIPPRSELLPRMAKVFHTRIENLIADGNVKTIEKHRPISEAQRLFDEVRKLPRKQQRKVLEMVAALVERYKQQESA